MEELIRIRLHGPASSKPVLVLVDASKALSALTPMFLRKLGWPPESKDPQLQFHHAEGHSILDPSRSLRDSGVRENHALVLLPLASRRPEPRADPIAALRAAEASELEALLPAAMDAATNVREKLSLGRIIARRRIAGGVPWAIRMLRDPDGSVVDAAVRILTRLRAEDRQEEIRTLLADPSGTARGGAARVLCRFDRPESRDVEIAALADDAHPAARAGAAVALSRLSIKGRESRLIRLLDDADASVRAAALGSLEDLESPALRTRIPDLLRDPSVDVRRNACDAASRLDAREGIPALIDNTRHEDFLLRKSALLALAELHALEAADAVRERLADGDGFVASAALSALTLLGVVTAEDAVRFGSHSDSGMRRSVVEALEKAGATKEIAPFLSDPDPSVQARACQAVGGPEAIRRLKGFLSHADPAVRACAADGLSRWSVREAAPDITALLSVDDEYPRFAALNALVRLDVASAVPSIVPLLDDPGVVRQDASETLLQLGTPELCGRLRGLLAHPFDRTRLEAIRLLQAFDERSAVPDLLPLLHDPAPWVRNGAIFALAVLGTESLAPELRRLLADPDSHVRIRAASALAFFGDRNALRGAVPPRDLIPSDCALLNAAREPVLWRRLRDLRMEGDLSGSSAELVAALARQAGLQADLGPLSRVNVWHRPDEPPAFRARSRITVLEALERSHHREMILEPGRVRIVRAREAVEEWSAWLERL